MAAKKKAKEVKAWAIITPDGFPTVGTDEFTRRACIGAFVGDFNENRSAEWAKWRKEGLSCRRVVIRVVK